jgi:hypothetical protein
MSPTRLGSVTVLLAGILLPACLTTRPLPATPSSPPIPTSTPAPPAATQTAETLPGVWTGQPTYGSDSPRLFHLTFDPSICSLMPTGMVPPNDRMLQHRTLSGCSIVPAPGHGLGPGWSVDQGSRMPGAVGFETVAVSENGALRFVNYFTGDSGFYTGFGVTVGAGATECLEWAEVVLASFQIVGGS